MAVNFWNLKHDKDFYIKLRAEGQRKKYVRTHARMQKARAKRLKKVNGKWNLSPVHLAY